MSTQNLTNHTLRDACRRGDVQAVQRLLAAGAATNQYQYLCCRQITPLHDACYGGHLDVVRLLLAHKAAVDDESRAGITPLYDACDKGNPQIVQLLLENGAKVEQGNSMGRAVHSGPLHVACENGCLQVVTLLLDAKASVHEHVNDIHHYQMYHLPMYYASVNGHLEVVRLLLDKGAHVDQAHWQHCQDYNKRTPLCYACEGGHLEVARLFLDRGASTLCTNPHHKRSLLKAAGGCVPVIKLLLDRGVTLSKKHEGFPDKSWYKNDAFVAAISKGHLDAAMLLFDNGADALDAGLSEACSIDRMLLQIDFSRKSRVNVQMVQLLLDKKADANQGMPMRTACGLLQTSQNCDENFPTEQHLEIIRLLLAHGADANKTITQPYSSRPYETLLQGACKKSYPEVVSLLLRSGASTDIEEAPVHPFAAPGAPASACRALLAQWNNATPGRRDAVRRHGWEYIVVPGEWTPANHHQFPAAFRGQFEARMIPLAALMAGTGPLCNLIGAGGPAVVAVLIAEALHQELGLTDPTP